MTKCIDLNTAEGIAAHMHNLPTANLRALAARTEVAQVAYAHAATVELILRGEK